MAAESSVPRTSMIDIFPLSGKPTSNQRQSGAAAFGAANSAESKRAEMIFLAGTFAEPAKRKRGARCWRNNCFSGVSSLRTAFRILEGNLPARRSSLSTTWSSDGVFTAEAVPRSLHSPASNSSAVENTLSNANVWPYRDSRLLIFKRKLKIFLPFP
jgi:hypothetical protein